MTSGKKKTPRKSRKTPVAGTSQTEPTPDPDSSSPVEKIDESSPAEKVAIDDSSPASKVDVDSTSFAKAGFSSDTVTVAEGLRQGDRIAINLPDEMTDGAKVQPIDRRETVR